MRILYLTEEAITFSDAMTRGGAIHVRNVVEGLRERGHEVHLVDWNDSPERPYQHSVSPRTRFVDGPLRTARQASSIAKARDVDVIISKTRKVYLPGLLAARRAGVPHVVHVGAYPHTTNGSLINRIDSASLRMRLRAPHDGYFVVCEAFARALRKLGISADRIYDVKNAVDSASFTPDPSPEYPRWLQQAVNQAGDGFKIGYVGGLYKYKGVRDLPPAIKQTQTNSQLFVAGEGPELGWLVNEDADATILGLVPYEMMPAVYHAMDAIVLPSYTEGLPRVILESQAMETPVIASRVGGVPEVVKDGETGLLHNPGDVEAFAEKIDRLAMNPTLRSQIGRAARSSIVEQWSWEMLYGRYEQFLTNVIRY